MGPKETTITIVIRAESGAKPRRVSINEYPEPVSEARLRRAAALAVDHRVMMGSTQGTYASIREPNTRGPRYGGMPLIPTLLGAAAALCSMGSFVPQALKVLRTGDSSGVSTRMYVITVIGFLLWSAYAALLRSWPLLASTLVCTALSALILTLKLRDRSPRKAAP